jgi:tetrapyrrole methylase family protein / MazG family protein
MNADSLTPARLLEHAVGLFGLDLNHGVQLWPGAALLAAARVAGVPSPEAEPPVRAWVETQGLGSYAPPSAPFPLTPTTPALLWWPAEQPALAAEIVALLTTRYPTSHPLRLAALDACGEPLASAELSLSELTSFSARGAAFAVCSLAPLAISADRRGVEALRWVFARLLGPGGCPWDVRQSHHSLRGALLEEAYEVLEALDKTDMIGLSEELGDLLIAIFVHSEMARQAGHFALEDVFEQTAAKLIRRHPHVFTDLALEDEGALRRNWEQIKAAELAAKGRARASLLDGVPAHLPALAAAQALGKKAARAGFNWTELAQVWAKVYEELDELAAAVAAGDAAHCAEELGDALFVLTRLADWLQIDAEQCLREANAKFRRRFGLLEQAAVAQARPLADYSLTELIALWNTVKG